nr:probable receptor-like protein kinase At4g39110 [Tanacetum cinerariifolium]
MYRLNVGNMVISPDYASIVEMGNSNTVVLNFNITCQFDLDGSHPSAGPSREMVATIEFAMMFAAFAGLGAMAVKWQKRPQPNLIRLLAKGCLEGRSW